MAVNIHTPRMEPGHTRELVQLLERLRERSVISDWRATPNEDGTVDFSLVPMPPPLKQIKIVGNEKYAPAIQQIVDDIKCPTT
jgi:hypothetical protein